MTLYNSFHLVVVILVANLVQQHLDGITAQYTSENCGNSVEWSRFIGSGTMRLKFGAATYGGWSATVKFNQTVRFFRSRQRPSPIKNIICKGKECTFTNSKNNADIGEGQEIALKFRVMWRGRSRPDVIWIALLGRDLCSSVSTDSDPSLSDVYRFMRPPMLEGEWHIHDPSRIIQTDNGYLMIAVTGRPCTSTCPIHIFIKHD